MRLAARFRVLMPSWRFFDRAVASPRLHVRIAGGEWSPVTVPTRGWLGWAFAPTANLALAYQAAVDHLVAEVSELDTALPDDAPEIVDSVAYALVDRIARTHVPPGAGFQWKIALPGDDGAPATDFVTSREAAA